MARAAAHQMALGWAGWSEVHPTFPWFVCHPKDGGSSTSSSISGSESLLEVRTISTGTSISASGHVCRYFSHWWFCLEEASCGANSWAEWLTFVWSNWLVGIKGELRGGSGWSEGEKEEDKEEEGAWRDQPALMEELELLGFYCSFLWQGTITWWLSSCWLKVVSTI